MAEGTSYAGPVQIQQQLYGRFCRLCRDPLPSDKYNLYRAWSLTKAGALLSNITGEDLSLEAEYAPQICKTCYRRLNTIAKQEDDMQKKRQLLSQAKEEVGSFLIAGRRFFTEGKWCRIPVSPRIHQHSPSTASPAPKGHTSTRQGAHCVRGLSEQMHQEARTQQSVLAQPLPVDKWTQTEMVREDIQLPRKVPLLCISFQDGAPTLEGRSGHLAQMLWLSQLPPGQNDGYPQPDLKQHFGMNSINILYLGKGPCSCTPGH